MNNGLKLYSETANSERKQRKKAAPGSRNRPTGAAEGLLNAVGNFVSNIYGELFAAPTRLDNEKAQTLSGLLGYIFFLMHHYGTR